MAKERLRSKVRGTPEWKRRQARLRRVVDPLSREVNSAADLKYGGAERSVQGQLRQSDAQAAQLPGFFDLYQARLREIHAQQQAGYDASRADLDRMATASRASQASAVPQAQQQADVTGASLDPAAAARQAGVQSRTVADTYGGLLRTQQQNQNVHGLETQRIGEGEKINQLLAERKRRSGIESKATDLARDKGDYKVQAREDLIEQRHKRILERKAFGLKVSQAEQDALDDAIKNQAVQDRIDLGQTNAQTAKDRLAETQRHNQVQENKASRKSGKRAYTRLQKRNAHEQLRSAIADAKAIRPKKGEGKTLVDYLRQGDPGANRKGETRPKREKYPPAIARAAAMYAIYGRIDSKTRRTLMEDYGIGGV